MQAKNNPDDGSDQVLPWPFDWKHNRITVRSPKTEHHEGKEDRIVSLFPQLRPYLQAALDELLEDFDPKAQHLSEQPVITRYRQRNWNLRTQFERIIRKAGLTPWLKLFHNLRGTWQTELSEHYPDHVACGWIGNGQAVAAKHYLQTTDDHFDKAAAELTGALYNTLPNAADETRSEANVENDNANNSLDCATERIIALQLVGDEGLEPPTFAV
jgi:integrase